MLESTEIPSLMDDVEFLAELEKLEGETSCGAVDRASRAALANCFADLPQPMPSPAVRPASPRRRSMENPIQPVIPRDVNRWNIHDPPGVEPERSAQGPASPIAAVVVIAIGLCAGAAGSALIFHDRVQQI